MKSRKEKNKNILIIVLIVIILLLISVLAILLLRGPENFEIGSESDPASIVEKNDGTISIPGYKSIVMEAGVKEQQLTLPNPPENNCVFILSLYLEDGTLLWQSDEVKPGEASDQIVLSKPLEAGHYENALLHYDCFTDDEAHTRLNSADVRLTIKVK